MPAPTIQTHDPPTFDFLKAISVEQERFLALADRQHAELVSSVQEAFDKLSEMETPFRKEVVSPCPDGYHTSLMDEFDRSEKVLAPVADSEGSESHLAEAGESPEAEVEVAAEPYYWGKIPRPLSILLRSYLSMESTSNQNDAQRLLSSKQRTIGCLKSVLDYVAGALVLLNALIMMVEFEVEGLAAGVPIGVTEGPNLAEVEPVFRQIDNVFVYLFLAELLFRIFAERWHFARDLANWFDAFLVLVSMIDLYVLSPLVTATDSAQTDMVRALRTLKSLRAIRVLRTFRFFDGLRLFAKACSSLLPSLGWSLVVLAMFICMGAMLLGNLLRSFILDESAPLEDRLWIWRRYGTAYRATYTLYEVTFAGNWPTSARPVMEKVSHVFVIFFLFYITIIVFAMIRLISAIFLKDTLDAAQNDAENLVLQRLRKKAEYLQKLEDVFKAIDETGDGMITEERLAKVFDNPTAVAYFQTLDIDVSESAALFHILDNGDGEVTHEEFIDGIMRCKGPARAMDQVALAADLRQLDSKLTKVMRRMQTSGQQEGRSPCG